jgi:hypothetical protein
MKRSSETITTIAPALLDAQKEINVAVKGSVNPHFNSKYAKFPDVVDAVKGPLNNHGIVFIQSVDRDEHGTFVETRLQHTSGEWIASYTPVLCKDGNNPQHQGSGITYAKRYGLESICGLPTEDDDGNAASSPRKKAPPKKTPLDVEAMQTKKGERFIKSCESADDAIAKIGQKHNLTADNKTLITDIYNAEG